MSKIFTTHFGVFPIRFVIKNDDLFVSKGDLYAAIGDCFTPSIRALGESFIDGGLSLLGDGSDRCQAILGDSEIGQVVHFHAAGNLLNSLGGLTDVDSPELRESSFRVSTLCRWYSSTLSRADEFFGRDIMDMLNSVKNRLDRLNPAISVRVTQEDGMYTAECDDLHLVTEATTLDELKDRVWELAPDMIEANDLQIDPESLRLYFQFSQTAAEQRRESQAN